MNFEEMNACIKDMKDNLDCLDRAFTSIQDCAQNSRFLTAKQVAERLGVSASKARQIMNRADFPSFNDGGILIVNEVAMFNYFQTKRTDNEWEGVVIRQHGVGRSRY